MNGIYNELLSLCLSTKRIIISKYFPFRIFDTILFSILLRSNRFFRKIYLNNDLVYYNLNCYFFHVLKLYLLYIPIWFHIFSNNCIDIKYLNLFHNLKFIKFCQWVQYNFNMSHKSLKNMRVMVQVTKTLAMSLILESKNIQIVIKRICEPISPF